jgi:hypothetical protein
MCCDVARSLISGKRQGEFAITMASARYASRDTIKNSIERLSDGVRVVAATFFQKP